MFKTELTTATIDEIEGAKVLALDLETTGLTLFSTECKIGKNTRIGGQSFTSYKNSMGGDVSVDTSLRVRVLSIAPEGDPSMAMAFDFDALGPHDKQRLSRVCVQGKILAGANLAFDLSWLTHYAPGAKPSGILDTHILVRTSRPAISQVGLPYRAAHAGRRPIRDAAQKMVSSGKTAASLAGLAIYFETPGAEDIDKRFQRPENWCVTPMSSEHHRYATGDVEFPVDLCRRLLKLTPEMSALGVYEAAHEDPAYARSEAAVLRLVDMHKNGMPFDLQKSQEMRQKEIEKLEAATQVIERELPDMFERNRDTLVSVKQSIPDSLKNDIADAAESGGVSLRDASGAPVLDNKSARLAGANDLPWWGAWSDIQDAKKRITMLSEYEDLAEASTRSGSSPLPLGTPSLHSLIGVNCATMRTSSTAPNLQNVPPALRAAYKSPEGYSMIAADYSQIELRIAAALAAEAWEEATTGSRGPSWALEVIDKSMRSDEFPPPESDPYSMDEGDAKLQAFMTMYRHDLSRLTREVSARGMPLVEVFRRGLDPHLSTALAMKLRQGTWSLPAGVDTILDYLSGLSKEETKAAKEEHSEARKAAKAVNFGLLYGMQAYKLWRSGVTDYGLDWTEDDAAEARAAWLDAYPEVAFWQVWTKVARKFEQLKRAQLAVPRKGGGVNIESKSIWRVETLTGRDCIAESLNKALNYQDQGTGADMALDAIVNIDDNYQHGWLVNLVHDEVVAIAPDDTAEEYAGKIKSEMEAAGDRILGKYGIPVEVEVGIGDWDH